ncbi:MULTISPECIES: MarR family winged helix-turn-helix transcriptional regulator [Sinobaca]|uniref:DNA-binding MarR family transcriptional regulator n=1 Tax=Sinobaca qinghaiensis TaxID=342944 RepID=A0A419V4G3_9BACL|nr:MULTISPECIES: MarR family transcriptional regulator [Sinobaca]RKD73276.1 DNA-binding MarR family transcriptional regulator [Sinobaca qinghaiensis]
MAYEEYKEILHSTIKSLESISRNLQPKLPLLQKLQLTTRQEAMMMRLVQDENVSISNLAYYLNISKSAVSQALNRLEKEELLIRLINEENRREMIIKLGPQGERLQEEFRLFEESIIQDYISQLKKEEIEQIDQTLKKLDKLIKETEE